MPVLAEFRSAAQIGDRVNSSMLQPEIGTAIEGRGHADVESAIASQHRRILAVPFYSFFIDHEHGHARAVFRVVPDLLDCIDGGIDGRRVHLAPLRALVIIQVIAVDRRRNRERLESEERFVLIPLSARCEHAAEGGKAYVVQLLALEVEELELRACIVFVLSEQLAAKDAHALEHGLTLRNNFLPVCPLRTGCVSHKHMVVRSVFVSGDIELSLQHIAAVEKVLGGGHFHRCCPSLQIH